MLIDVLAMFLKYKNSFKALQNNRSKFNLKFTYFTKGLKLYN